MNDIGLVKMTTDRSIPFMVYNEDRNLVGFILIDKMTNEILGAGLINFELNRENNLKWQNVDASYDHHATLKIKN